MADDERAGEAVTANYGWTKPNVMGSDDQWGGYLNADLDGIDTTVKSVSTVANAAYPASNPAGYITAAAIPAPYVLPTASTTVLGGVKVDGSTITISGGTISGTPSSGPPVTISDTAPVGPQVGALWWDSVKGQLFTFYNDGNSSQWVIAVNAAASLLPASTTVLGGVKVDGTTIQAAVDGTISTTVVPICDNRIINGDMRIDQRNNGANGSASGYTVDRWQYFGAQAGKFSWQRNAGSATTPAGFPYYFGFVSSTAYASLVADYFFLNQNVEADFVSDFAWGTASAQPITLQFWAWSSLTGTFSGAIANAANTRCYAFTYSIPVTNTWTKIVLTIPGDTGGTWALSGNGAAFGLQFDLGSGSTRRGPSGVWTTVAGGNTYIGATGAVSVVGTLNATFFLTGVKLEVGSVATPYNRQSLAKSMADCQRYYQTGSAGWWGYGGAGAAIGGYIPFPVSMRAAPTINTSAGVYTNCSGLALQAATISGVYFQSAATALGSSGLNFNYTNSAEL